MTLKQIRWLHLSDFHMGKDNYAQRNMIDYIVGHVKKKKSEGFIPHFLFITGDLADKGLQPQFTDFWLECVDPIQNEIGNDIAKRTFVVPGNHDVDRKVNPAFSREEMTDAKSRYFDASEEGKLLRGMLLSRFQSFCDSDQTSHKAAWGEISGGYSEVQEINGVNVGIVGINTAWLCKDELDERKLTPGKSLLENLLKSLTSSDLRIILGHHPIDWFVRDQQKPIKSLFGKSNVIYLHGHLHDFWTEPSNGGGSEFITIQSGAAFQAREGEKWKNGLVWGEANIEHHELRLQPWHWSKDHQDWCLCSDAYPNVMRKEDWWVYPLPGHGLAEKMALNINKPIAHPPPGWSVTSAVDLQHYIQPLDEESAIKFFDGAVPTWKTALSTSIPRRSVVRRLVESFENIQQDGKPNVTVLLAAGCEGKTTALLQSAFEIANKDLDWRILRRLDDSQSFQGSVIFPTLIKPYRWLIIIDEADQAAEVIFGMMRQIPKEIYGRIHFLIACRDSDWQSTGAHSLNWLSGCAFHQETLLGLENNEAEQIVTAWGIYGKKGLGDLEELTESERADMLNRKALEESKTTHGAFFGALLSVRHGSDLPNHGRLMLERLNQKPISNSHTLRDAIVYVAIMHASGLEILSRPVLARALGCDVSKLHRDVLVPLGQEAAATVSSSFIFTRHKRIAEMLVTLLEQDLAEDIGQRYVELAVAAIEAYQRGEHVPDLAGWRFRLAQHFFNQGNTSLALAIATGVLSREPSNIFTLTKVSNLFRKAGQPSESLAFFRRITRAADVNRGLFTEWAFSEKECGNEADGIILAAYSLSDNCYRSRVNVEDGNVALLFLAQAFSGLYSKYKDSEFSLAVSASCKLGLMLDNEEITRAKFNSLKDSHKHDQLDNMPLKDIVEVLFSGIISAHDVGVDSVIKYWITDIYSLNFDGLKRLLTSAGQERHSK